MESQYNAIHVAEMKITSLCVGLIQNKKQKYLFQYIFAFMTDEIRMQRMCTIYTQSTANRKNALAK